MICRRCKYLIAGVFFVLLLGGCATTQKSSPVVSDIFNNEIRKKVRVAHVIDTRVDKSITKDIKELRSYRNLYENTIISSLNHDGYLAVELKEDINDCPSLKDIMLGKQIPCLTAPSNDNADITFLISIDEYIPPKSMSMKSKIGITGIFYNHKTNNILWKYSLTNESGNEVAMFGIGGYIGGILAKSVSSEDIPYSNAAYGIIRALMKSIPECPEDECNR